MSQVIVIRYCPDIVKGEFVNVGVLICDNDLNPKRYAEIAESQLFRMADFFGISQRSAYKIVSNLADEFMHWTSSMIKNWHQQDFGSIVFCEPRGTLRDIDDALIDARKRYLE